MIAVDRSHYPFQLNCVIMIAVSLLQCHQGCYFSLQNMIDYSLLTPIQDQSVFEFPLELVSEILQQVSLTLCAHITTVPVSSCVSFINPLTD